MKPNKAYENKKKYLHPPTVDQILYRLKSMKVKAAHFELYFGIPKGTITLVKLGQRDFPAKFWHLIFENVKIAPVVKRKVGRPRTRNTENPTKTEANQQPPGLLSHLQDIIKPE